MNRCPLPGNDSDWRFAKTFMREKCIAWHKQFDESEKCFNAASSLAERYQPALEPEVLNSQAVLQTNEKKYPEARRRIPAGIIAINSK